MLRSQVISASFRVGQLPVGRTAPAGSGAGAVHWTDPRLDSTGRYAGRLGLRDKAKLLERSDSVVEADLFDDQTVDDLQHGGPREAHRLASPRGQGTDRDVVECVTGLGAAADPLAHDIVAPSAIRSAVPPNAKSGNAARNLVANARTSSRPRHGACIEYSNRISGAASSSMTPALKSGPQNSVNHRSTTALFCSIDIDHPSLHEIPSVPRIGHLRLVDGWEVQNVRCVRCNNRHSAGYR